MAKHKIHTIHHFGLAFFEHEDHALDRFTEFEYPQESSIVFEGFIEDIPREVAQKVAEVHPNYQNYYEMAMMPLYKTYSFRSGTENPVLAIETRRFKKERDEDLRYVIIWDIFS